MKEETKLVRLSPSLVEQLEVVKKTLGLRSLGEAAKLSLDFATSPLSILSYALEARGNIQELLEEVKKLNQNLERIIQIVEKTKAINE